MCFKIEGRMKTPEYVATATRIYRKYIDLAQSSKPYIVDENDRKELMQVFNRGGFSTGHLSPLSNKDLVYNEKSNNMGIYLGNVSNVKEQKSHIFLNLNDTLSIGDSIMFEHEKTKYTVSELMHKEKNLTTAMPKQLIEIGRMKGNINIGDKVYKISSKELNNIAKSSYQEEHKKTYLQADITVKKDRPIVLKVQTLDDTGVFNNISLTLQSDVTPVEANSRPIDKDRIVAQLSKTKNTVFEFKTINVDLDDNVFVSPISELNELRRNALEQIENIAKSNVARPTPKKPVFKDFSLTSKVTKKPKISLLLNILQPSFNYDNLKNVDRIYIPLKFFSGKQYKDIITSISSKFDTYIYMPTVVKSNYINILSNVIEASIDEYNIKGFVVSNISAKIFAGRMIKNYKDKYDFIGNYTLNVYNNYTLDELASFGISTVTISPELDKNTINGICNSTSNADKEIIVYGNTPLMSINYCLLGETNRCYPDCGTRCRQEGCKYYLKDRLGLMFRILPDSIQTVSTIYNSKITSINGTDFNVSSYRIDILDETIDEINNIIDCSLSGNRLEGNEYTNGNLNKDI